MTGTCPVPHPSQNRLRWRKTTVTSQMGATAGAPPQRLSQHVHGFWKHFTPSYIASGCPTITTALKWLPVVLMPFALFTFEPVRDLTRGGWAELFANGWAWWASHPGGYWCYCRHLHVVFRFAEVCPILIHVCSCVRLNYPSRGIEFYRSHTDLIGRKTLFCIWLQ